MEVLDHDTHEHVEHEEAHQENEWNEVEQSPLRIVLYWLKISKLSSSILELFKWSTSQSRNSVYFFVLCITTMCTIVSYYQHFEGTCHLHRQGRNTGSSWRSQASPPHQSCKNKNKKILKWRICNRGLWHHLCFNIQIQSSTECRAKIFNIVFKHPVALLHFTHENYFRHNAAIYSFILLFYNMFRPQSTITRCSYFAKTVTLYWISVIHFMCIILDAIFNQIML
jgi:hypothetical protein